MNARKWVALSWGVLIGTLTLSPAHVAVLSDHTALAIIQVVFVYLMIPGLVLSAMVGSLLPGAAINALIHFGLCFFLLRFVPRFRPMPVRD